MIIPIIIILALLAAVFFFILNYRNIMIILASLVFLIALIIIPSAISDSEFMLALLGSNYTPSGAYFIAFWLILLVVFLAAGKDIMKNRVLNFFMGLALIGGLIITLAMNF